MGNMCEKKEGIPIVVEFDTSSEDPWFLLPSSLPPGLPPTKKPSEAMTHCEPCTSRTLGKEQFETQHHDIAATRPLPFSCPSVGSMLHGTGLCKPCYWFW